ncbi:hypothetical protein AA103196_1562 [Ameyamaea chiangmaiensis NBRC 103196]|uniref:Uncharacterized protein n=1 Tax=Ameyamaea chiangmaiensis TaxID=442969 RepID=A0A850PEU4_9PROT|nr:hypothetical protein [Ameyamaea chiangmaiensis]MBS4076087.1 hypothetical protein [Ameyamaea chiangmaiensis]NVN40980.1 hypothetical protein [Ameyamaea chiangmaiensis]GBQ66978.1 hypothetical protein AA103196_1562 [Ameyamaea chiangmaiensis NBRC 103196]
MHKKAAVLGCLAAFSVSGITRASAADAGILTPDTSCAALIFYTRTDNVGDPTPAAKARFAALLDMMKPYRDALTPRVASDVQIRDLFAALDRECRKDQGEALGVAVRKAGDATIDAANKDLRDAGGTDHGDAPAP